MDSDDDTNRRGHRARVAALNVQIFADGADLSTMIELAGLAYVKGFTTNPTLMRKAGVRDYEAFAKERCAQSPIARSPLKCSQTNSRRWSSRHTGSQPGRNVYVKIPVTNTRGGTFRFDLIRRLSAAGVRVNVTAVFTLGQVVRCCPAWREAAAFVSIFAGRIADTGTDPGPLVAAAVDLMRAVAERQAYLGESAGAAQSLSGRPGWLSRDYHDGRPAGKAIPRRQRPRAVFS